MTPSFNGAETLERLWKSLCAQTFTDFEWLLVDDGSTDDTAPLIERLAKISAFEVRYLRQHNQGKHIALNTGLRAARGEFIAVVDADDWYPPQALERLFSTWMEIDDRTAYVEVQALCATPSGELIGDRFPCEQWLDSDAFEMAYRHHVRGDKTGMQRATVLREFPFPETFRGVCVPEALIWFRIAEHYRTRYINEILTVKEYREGGLTSQERSHAVERSGPRRQFFRELAETPRPMPRSERLRAYANWARNAHLSGVSLRQEAAGARAPFTFVSLAPVGILLALRDRRRAAAAR